ncbi:hypothetical protein Ancab_034015 [Ancistrocladus abbreviatus]
MCSGKDEQEGAVHCPNDKFNEPCNGESEPSPETSFEDDLKCEMKDVETCDTMELHNGKVVQRWKSVPTLVPATPQQERATSLSHCGCEKPLDFYCSPKMNQRKRVLFCRMKIEGDDEQHDAVCCPSDKFNEPCHAESEPVLEMAFENNVNDGGKDYQTCDTMKLRNGKALQCWKSALPFVPATPQLESPVPQRHHRCKKPLAFNCTTTMSKRRRALFGSVKNEGEDEQHGAVWGPNGKFKEACHTESKLIREIAFQNKFQILEPGSNQPAKCKRASYRKTQATNVHHQLQIGLTSTQRSDKCIMEMLAESTSKAHYYTRAINRLVTHQVALTESRDLREVSKVKSKKKRLNPKIERSTITQWRRLLAVCYEANDESSCLDERLLFHRRVCSFIVIIQSMLGCRRYSPWKGSVLDSLIGAFLTQNVYDQFSSSAFMSLAARFPRQQLHYCLNGKSQSPRKRKRASSETQRVAVLRKHKVGLQQNLKVAWDSLRTEYYGKMTRESSDDTMDCLDWNAVRQAKLEDISTAISSRGMNNRLAQRIKDFLQRLMEDHGSLDLEWLRVVPAEKAKEFLLSIYGIGLKSAECVRLLTLCQNAFPVDTNVGRIVVRLGWVPVPPISKKFQMHLLNKYRIVIDSIHHYLWPRLCHLNQNIFGALKLSVLEENCKPTRNDSDTVDGIKSPFELPEKDIEEICSRVGDGTTGKFNIAEPKAFSFTASAAASSSDVRMTSRMRTKHPVFELPDSHPLLEELELHKREPHDPSPYLLVAWKQGKLENPIEQTAGRCENNSSSSCHCCIADSETVKGTIMIPCQTAVGRRFPLNGTYFQTNEVFADHASTRFPLDVPWKSIRELPSKTLYCGTSIGRILKGLSADEIRKCFIEGAAAAAAWS